MGDFSDPEISTNLLQNDKQSSSSSSHYPNYPNPNPNAPTSSSSSSYYPNPNTPAGGGGGGGTAQKQDSIGMTNKSYTGPGVGGGGGGGGVPTVALTYTENNRLQRRVARLTSYLYGLTVVVVVGGVILIATIASLYAKLYYDLKHHSHQPKVGAKISKILEREELCVPCSEIRLGPSPEEEAMLNVFTKRDSREGQKCCVERPAELLRLLELYINKTYRQEIAKGNIKIRQSSSSTHEDKPAAHLMGYPQTQDQSRVPGRQFPITLWVYEEDLAFINHVTYRYGRIVVPEDGLYYVYSQVAFLEIFSPSGSSSSSSSGSSSGGAYGTESPSLSHYLYRYNIIYHNGGEEKLVQNSITKCWGPHKAFGEYTSYLGAVFHLRQGDEVFVKVSNLTMMALEPKSNYFGLFKL